MIPDLVKVWDEYEPKGLVLLALSDEASGTIEKHIEKMGMTFPVASGAKGKRAYGVSGIPAGFLIDHTGKIIWSGNPGNKSWVNLVDDALAKAEQMADQWEPGDRPEYLKKAVSLAQKGEMGKAWRETENLMKKFAEEPVKRAEVANFQTDFEERAKLRTVYADSFGETGRYHEASLYLQGQIKVFKGSPAATAWEAQLKSWKKDAAIKKLMDLDKKRVKALEMVFDGKADKAKKDLLALNKKVQGTPLAGPVQEAYEMASTFGK